MDSNLLQTVTNQITAAPPGQLALSKELRKSLMPEEVQVIDLQQKCIPLSKYGELELQTQVAIMLFKISTITGWKIPDEKMYEDALIEQMILKIKEDYYFLNVDEILHAFRKYGTVIKDWGKAFNLSLVDQVLIPYLNFKRDVNQFAERIRIENMTEEKKANWKILCEENYEQFLTGKYNIELWPWQMYDEFVKGKMMAADVYEDHLNAAYYFLITKPAANNAEKDFIIEVKKQDKSHHRVIEMAKRFAVKILYSHAMRLNYKNLFYEKG